MFTLDIDSDAKLYFYRHRQFNAIQLVGVAEANCDIRFAPTAINSQRRCEWQWLVFVAETCSLLHIGRGLREHFRFSKLFQLTTNLPVLQSAKTVTCELIFEPTIKNRAVDQFPLMEHIEPSIGVFRYFPAPTVVVFQLCHHSRKGTQTELCAT
jgi:hypothetical protein